MQPRETRRRIEQHYEEQTRQTKLAWEIGITAACIQANRIPQYKQEDGTVPQPLQPADFLPWLEGSDDTSGSVSVEDALAAGVERGRRMSERLRASVEEEATSG